MVSYTEAGEDLVDALDWGHLAHLLVEGLAVDGTVVNRHLARLLVHPRESVLGPAGIIAFGEVLAGVGTTRLLSGVRGKDGLACLESCVRKVLREDGRRVPGS